MTLRGPLLRSLRHLGNVLVDIGIENGDQRFDMKHKPAYRQIAVIQLRRQRTELCQFIVEILQDAVHDRVVGAVWQLRAYFRQLLYRRARRGSTNSGCQQPIHFAE